MIPDPITVEEDRVILRGELAESVIFDGLEWSDSEHVEAYRALFEGVGKFPGDPSESYYQGLTFTCVIRRKSDGRLFGFSYWEDISKYGEPSVEPNGDEHDLEREYDEEWEPIGGAVFVFLPAKEFQVQGYTV